VGILKRKIMKVDLFLNVIEKNQKKERIKIKKRIPFEIECFI